MKVLLVAPPSAFWDQVQHALRSYADVQRFDTRRFMLAGGVASKAQWLWRMLRGVRALKEFNTRLIGDALVRESVGFDAILLYKFGDVPLSALASMRRRGIRIAAWQIDPPNEPTIERMWSSYAPVMDVVFHFDSAMALSKQPCRIVHLPLAVDVERFTASRSEANQRVFDADVSFIGAAYPERVRLLQLIAHHTLAIYGWEGWRRTSLAQYYRGPVTVDEAARIYAHSKLSVNINWNPPVAGVNLKTFEIPAAGGTQLTDIRTDLHALYDADEEVVAFRTDEEFVVAVDKLVTDDALRERIRIAGVARTLKEHTLTNRARLIIETLRELL